MKLLTKALRMKLPRLYATEKKGDEALVICKFFTPDSSWTWYATEFDGTDRFFGLVDGHEAELGYFSLSELESVRGKMGLPIERDLYWREQTLGDVKEQMNRSRTPHAAPIAAAKPTTLFTVIADSHADSPIGETKNEKLPTTALAIRPAMSIVPYQRPRGKYTLPPTPPVIVLPARSSPTVVTLPQKLVTPKQTIVQPPPVAAMDAKRLFAFQKYGYMDVTGHVNVQAIAHDEGEPIVLYLSGATTAVTAIRATLNGRKKGVRYSRRIYGGARLKASKPMRVYHSRDENLAEDHMLLLSMQLIQPLASHAYTYVLGHMADRLAVQNATTVQALGQRIRLAVTIPILPTWYTVLVQRGYDDGMITDIAGEGCRLWSVMMNEDYWTETVQVMLKSQLISINEENETYGVLRKYS